MAELTSIKGSRILLTNSPENGLEPTCYQKQCWGKCISFLHFYTSPPFSVIISQKMIGKPGNKNDAIVLVEEEKM